MLLGHIAETNNDRSCWELGDRRPHVALLDKELDQHPVQKKTKQHQHKIAEKLHPAMQNAPAKDDIPVEEEAGGEADAKSEKDRGHIGRHVSHVLRRKRNVDGKRKMNGVLMEDIVVAEPIHEDIHYRSRSPTRSITERLLRHIAAERRIEEINKGDDAFFQ